MKDTERKQNILNNGKTEYVMAAAVWINDGNDAYFCPFNIDKGYVVSGWRHVQCWGSIWAITGKRQCEFGRKGVNWEDGFLTTKNRFLNRTEALALVIENGQLVKSFFNLRINDVCKFCTLKCASENNPLKSCKNRIENNRNLIIGGTLTSEDLW